MKATTFWGLLALAVLFLGVLGTVLILIAVTALGYELVLSLAFPALVCWAMQASVVVLALAIATLLAKRELP